MTTSRPYILWAVLSAAGILSGSSTVWGKDLPTQTGEIFAMDTYMTVSATGENAKDAVDASLEEIQKLDALWSVGNEDSVVSRLNRNESVELDEDTSGLLQKALEISTDTDRAFDITVYPLMEEWGFTTGEFKVPSRQRLEELLEHVDAGRLEYDGESTFTLPEDAVSCSVSVPTVIGKFTVQAETENVQFTISVDGQEMDGSTVEGIPAGSQVDIKAKTARDQRLSGWIINGEKKGSTDTLYSCNITENMSVAVTTEPVDEYSLKIKAEGGGTLNYVITDTEGAEVGRGDVGETPADEDDPVVSVYKGDSVIFRASENNTEYTLTSISMDGVKQDLTEGTFTINSIEGDTEILARFGPNTYQGAKFTKNFRSEGAMLLDENDDEIANEEILTVPKNREIEFSVVLSRERYCYVNVNGADEDLEPYKTEEVDQDWKKYYFRTESITTDISISAADHQTYYIDSKNVMTRYLAAMAASISLNRPYDQPDGVLLTDIDMSEGNIKVTAPIAEMYGRFDGNGYTISNLSVKRASDVEPRASNFLGIFGTIHEEAYIKDVVFKGINVYADNSSIPGNGDGCGILAYKNYGTISGVTILDSEADILFPNRNYYIGGLAYENLGVIEHCMVNGLTLETDHYFDPSGAGGVVYNQLEGSEATAYMTGNYFENVREYKPEGAEEKAAEEAPEAANEEADEAADASAKAAENAGAPEDEDKDDAGDGANGIPEDYSFQQSDEGVSYFKVIRA